MFFFLLQVLFSMWQHQELREVYRKSGWKESDFVTKTVAARNARPNSPTHLNSTLNRPMASQGGTRYEDRYRTIFAACCACDIYLKHLNIMHSYIGFYDLEIYKKN